VYTRFGSGFTDGLYVPCATRISSPDADAARALWRSSKAADQDVPS
jgi:hypothetical protein